ncbi:MAG: PspC domain-containing protein [Streptococcaceae bacterium]|nr:PspC domain-containing protein [Streptococcaceae bacterium]
MSFILFVLVVPFVIGLILNQQLGIKLSRTDKKLLGVAGGIAEYFKVDATIVRIVLALLIVFTVVSFPSYFTLALGMSKG